MLLTNNFFGDILRVQSEKGGGKALLAATKISKEVFAMIYDRLNEMEEKNEYYGISPLTYVVLDCAK